MVREIRYIAVSFFLFGIILLSNVKGSVIEKIYCNTTDCFSDYKSLRFVNGYYQFYLISGNDTFLSREGMIINKKMEGEWVYFHRNKNTYRKVFMVNDTVFGAEIRWFETGKLESIGKYKGTTQIGLHVTFYENGNIRSERSFNCEGEMEGAQKQYYESGRIMFEEIYPVKKANIDYNANTCGDGTMTLTFMLDSEEQFHGNEWYENGQKKVVCNSLKKVPYTIEVLKYDTLGNLIMKGSLVYTKREKTCWFKTGVWIYFDVNGGVKKKENW